jgi:hypothetical protein
MDLVISNAQMPRSCIRLDGKYCFYVEKCKVFQEASYMERRDYGTVMRLAGCPLSIKDEEKPYSKNGTLEDE